MSGRLGRSSHAIARETTPNPTMSAAKIATGTYHDTRLLLWEIAPEGEYIARVVGPEVAVPFRARRVVDRIPLALGVPVGGDAAPGAGPHLQRGDHAALDRRLLQLRLPARPRLRRPTTARRRRLRAGTGRVLGGLLLRRSPRRRAGLAVAGPDVAALEAFVLDFPPAMRVLVVEDETDLGEVFRDFLSELGHQPVLVRSAEAALGKLQTDRPDAIILDIHLPGMSGLDFLQLRPVRESGLPIVAVSGVATESQARECLRLGALDFVGKPVLLERLHDVLIFLEPHAISRTREESARRADRRQSPRARLEMPVTLREYRGASWSGTCVELSMTGMKVKTDATLSSGVAVRCAFQPPDDGAPLDIISLVLRLGPDGAALSFVNLPGHEARRLGEIVRRLTR